MASACASACLLGALSRAYAGLSRHARLPVDLCGGPDAVAAAAERAKARARTALRAETLLCVDHGGRSHPRPLSHLFINSANSAKTANFFGQENVADMVMAGQLRHPAPSHFVGGLGGLGGVRCRVAP